MTSTANTTNIHAKIIKAAGYSLSITRERMSNGLYHDAPLTRTARQIRESNDANLVAAFDAYISEQREKLEAESKSLFGNFDIRINRCVFNRQREKRKALAEIRRVTDRLAIFRGLSR